jgi:hypothetical protein
METHKGVFVSSHMGGFTMKSRTMDLLRNENGQRGFNMRKEGTTIPERNSRIRVNKGERFRCLHCCREQL